MLREDYAAVSREAGGGRGSGSGTDSTGRRLLLCLLLGNEGQELLVGHFANRELDGAALRAGDFGLLGPIKALQLADRLQGFHRFGQERTSRCFGDG